MEYAGIALTEQFYDWEQRGRGWLLADAPADLEPPFHPFFRHIVPKEYVDDGKHETMFSAFAGLFKSPTAPPVIAPYTAPPLEFFPTTATDQTVFLSVAFPTSSNPSATQMEQCMALLTQTTFHLSFELIATSASVVIQLSVQPVDVGFVRAQLHAFFPECSISDTSDMLVLQNNYTIVVDFGLEQEFMRPLATLTSETDPHIPLFGIWERLDQYEQVSVQVLFTKAINNWSESIIAAVSDDEGRSFFVNAPEMPRLAQEKVARPLVAAVVRVLVQATDKPHAERLLSRMCTILNAATSSPYNCLAPLVDAASTYSLQQRVTDFISRQSRRIGMLLNLRELTLLAHFPNAAIRSTKLVRSHSRTVPVSDAHRHGSLVLGKNNHQGKEVLVYQNTEERLRHTHIIGATGTGKTSILQHLIYQDIAAGNGIAVIDPHGDLIDTILTYIPRTRIADVVLIDPSDPEYVTSFNLLSSKNPLEHEILAADLVALFRRFSSSWGDQMTSVLANALLAVLDSKTGGTLIELRRFLIEKPFREALLKTVSDPAIVYYWQHEFPLLKSSSLGPILTRLDTFLRPMMIRSMVSQKESIDFANIFDTQKIVLVKLSHGLLGAENSFIIGASIIARIQQTALARQAHNIATRTPFYLYIDECHHFATESTKTLLSGARKYGLGLILAHQSIHQLSTADEGLSHALLANAGTRICFRVGESDAKRLAEGFASFRSEDMLNLRTGSAVARIGSATSDFSLVTISLSPEQTYQHALECIEHSRATYSKPRTSLIPSEPPPVLVQPPPPPEPIIPEQIDADTIITELHERTQKRTHRHLQTLLKKQAESRGYIATLEVPIKEGDGRVDVVLAKSGKTIACEIGLCTTLEWELHNIEKCLTAGYKTVCWLSTNTDFMQKMRAAVSARFTELQLEQLIITTPETVLELLEPMPVTPPPENIMRGYRVSVSYEQASSLQQEQKRATVAAIVRNTTTNKS